MIRAFIAVEIPSEVLDRIAATIEILRARLRGIHWVTSDNVHLTLKFLGDIDQSQIEPIGAALADALGPFPRCIISAKGLGVFPSLRQPRVLWVGLAGNSLNSLAATVQSALTPFGFAPEVRPFRPHLTIGRVRPTKRIDRSLGLELERWTNHDFGASAVDKVILFRSELRPTGAIYTRLTAVALRPEPLF